MKTPLAVAVHRLGETLLGLPVFRSRVDQNRFDAGHPDIALRVAEVTNRFCREVTELAAKAASRPLKSSGDSSMVEQELDDPFEKFSIALPEGTGKAMEPMTIKAVPVRSAELRPGDLFSTAGPDYWSRYDPRSLGQRVYIRTESPTPADQADEPVFRIEIETPSGRLVLAELKRIVGLIITIREEQVSARMGFGNTTAEKRDAEGRPS